MEHGGSGVSGRWPPTLFLCRQEPSTELPYNICVVRENLFRTRITRTNTDKKETKIREIRVNPCPKDLVAAGGRVMALHLKTWRFCGMISFAQYKFAPHIRYFPLTSRRKVGVP